MPRLGSFNSTDPLWWKSPDKTSYHYCANNPVRFIDPDGEEIMDGDYYKNGIWQYSDDIDDNKIYEFVSNSNLPYDEKNPGALPKEEYRYVGDVVDVKLSFTGETIGKMSKGELDVIQVGSNSKEYTRLTVEAVSGTKNRYYSLPDGDYKITRPYSPSSPPDRQGYVVDGYSFAIDLIPQFKTNRSALQIHPDENFDGTAGCIGIRENKSTLQVFFNLTNGYYKQFGGLNLNVNIKK